MAALAATTAAVAELTVVDDDDGTAADSESAAEAVAANNFGGASAGAIAVTDDGGVSKIVLRAGKGACPTAGSSVSCTYIGTLSNASVRRSQPEFPRCSPQNRSSRSSHWLPIGENGVICLVDHNGAGSSHARRVSFFATAGLRV